MPSSFENSLSGRGNLSDWLSNPSAGGIVRMTFLFPEWFVPIKQPIPVRAFVLPTTLPDAYAEWGGPSDFSSDNDKFEELIANRVSSVVRVTNPEDDTQFVDVEVTQRASFQDPETGKRMRLIFGN